MQGMATVSIEIEKKLEEILEKDNFMRKVFMGGLGQTKEELFKQNEYFIENQLEYTIYGQYYDVLRQNNKIYNNLFNKETRFNRFSKAYDKILKEYSSEKFKKDGTLKLSVEDDWMEMLNQEYHVSRIARERRDMNELALNVLDKPVEELTTIDKLILKNYTGKGGIGEEGAEILTQYFTDYKTIDFIWRKIEGMGFPIDGIKALEPSCGIGSFIGLSPEGIDWDAIEIDATLVEMIKRLYPNVNVMHKSFEDHNKDNYYDLVITNVPFCNSRGMGLVKDKPDIRKLHDYFILASMDKLKPNGMAVLIVPSSFMDSVNPKIREMVSSQAELLSSYRLPDNVFAKTGADVVTDILFFRKRVFGTKDEIKEFDNNKLFLKVGFPERFQRPSRQLPLNEYYMQNGNNILGSMVEYKNRYGQYIIKVTGSLTDYMIKRALSNKDYYKPADIKEKIEDKPAERTVEELLKDVDMKEIAPIGGLFKLKQQNEEDNSEVFNDNLGLMEKVLKDMNKTSWYRRDLKKVKGQLKESATPVFLTKGTEKRVEAILEIAKTALFMRQYAKKGDTDAVQKIAKKLEEEVGTFKKQFTYVFENKELQKVMSEDIRYSIVKVLCNDPDIFKTDTITQRKYHIPLKDNTDIKEVCQYLILNHGKITVHDFATIFKGGISLGEAEAILNSSYEVFKLPSLQERQIYDKGEIVTVLQEMQPCYERAIDYLSGNIYKKIEFAQREIESGNLEYQKNVEELKKVLPKPRTLNDIMLSVRHKWIDISVIEDFVRHELGFKGFNLSFDEIKRSFNVNFTDYGCTKHETAKKLNIGYCFADWVEKYLNGKEIIIRNNEGYKDVVASARMTEKMKVLDELFMTYLSKNPEISKPILEKYNYLFNNTKIKDYSKENLIIPEVGKGWKFRQNQLEAINMALSLGKCCISHRVGGGKTAISAAVNHMLKVTGRAKKPMQIVPGKIIKKFVRDIKKGSRGLAPVFPNMKILDVTEYEFNEALAMIAYNEWDLILIPDTWFKRISLTPQREMEYIDKQIIDLKISESYRAKDRGTNRQRKEFEKRLLAFEARLAELRNYVRCDGLYFEDLGVDAISLDEAQSVKNLVASVKGSELGLSATPSQVAMDFNMKTQYIMEINNGNNVFLYTATPVSNSILEIYGLFLNIAPYEWQSRYIYTADDFIDFFADTSVTYGITKENEVGVVRKVDGFINLDDLRALFRKYVDYRVSIENMELPELEETRVTVDMTMEQRLFFNSLLKRLENIPADKSIDNVLKILIEGRQASISGSLFSGQNPTRENSPKIAKCIELVTKIYKEVGGNQLIFLDQYGKSILGSDDLHTFIKKELVKEGIPANEIVICNGIVNSSMEKKLEIQDMFNDGIYRVLIGTTDSIGAGMDLQEMTIASHNLDIPWTPTSVQQKIGRMNRPGNMLDTILTLNYYVRGSYDAWSASIVAIKKKWQEQLLLGGMDSVNGYTKNKEDDSWSMETIMAEIMEDPKEKAIMNFKVRERTLLGEKESLEERILKHTKSIDDLTVAVEEREEKIEEYKNNLNKGIKVKLAKMRIKQLTETINKLMEETNQLASEVEDFERQLRNVEREIKAHKESYEQIIAKAERSPVVKSVATNLDEIVYNLKDSNKNVEELTENNYHGLQLASFNFSTDKTNEKKTSQEKILQPQFNMFSIEKLQTPKKKEKQKKTEQFVMNLDFLM